MEYLTTQKQNYYLDTVVPKSLNKNVKNKQLHENDEQECSRQAVKWPVTLVCSPVVNEQEC